MLSMATTRRSATKARKTKNKKARKRPVTAEKPADCPLNGQCLTKSVIYQATVTTEDDGSKETYIGLTKNVFKERFNGHKMTFRHFFKQAQQHRTKQIRLEIKRARKTIQHQMGRSSVEPKRKTTNLSGANSAHLRNTT